MFRSYDHLQAQTTNFKMRDNTYFNNMHTFTLEILCFLLAKMDNSTNFADGWLINRRTQDFKSKCMHVVEISVIPHLKVGCLRLSTKSKLTLHKALIMSITTYLCPPGNLRQIHIQRSLSACKTRFSAILANVQPRFVICIYYILYCILYFSILLHSFNTEYLFFCPSM
jgi:hypothetical protein